MKDRSQVFQLLGETSASILPLAQPIMGPLFEEYFTEQRISGSLPGPPLQFLKWAGGKCVGPEALFIIIKKSRSTTARFFTLEWINHAIQIGNLAALVAL